MTNSRPNVLFVVTDQQQAAALGVTDDSFSTPNLDELADDGTLFTNAYCSHPQCSPSRSSLLTGRFPHQTGVFSLTNWGDFELDPTTPSVGASMRDAGYETLYLGRWDLGVENVVDLGWEYPRNVDVTGSTGEKGVRRDRTTVAEIDRYLRQRDGTDPPFFVMASLNMPHPPFFEVEAFADRYDRASVPLPENWEDDLADKPAFHRERARQCGLDVERVREMRYQYRTMVSQVDAWVGELLDALRREGIYEETMIVFTSDHGDMQGSHRLEKKGVIAYEEILRVPLIVCHSGVDVARDRVPDLVSTTAIPGTILDAAGEDVPESFEGGSLLPVLRRSRAPSSQRVFFEHHYAYWGHHPYRGIRTSEWKYVENLLDERNELYHIAEDPYEMTNLAVDSDYEDTVTDLQTEVEEWWDETGGDEDAWIAEPPGPGA